MTKRIVSLVLVLMMLVGMIISTVSCAQLEAFIGEENLGDEYMDKYYPDRNNGGTTENPDQGGNGGNEGEDTVKIPNKGDPDVPKIEGYNQITFFWNNPMTDYSKSDIWVWWDGEDGKGRLTKPCEYGRMVTLNVPEDITEVGFIVRKNCTDPGGDSWGYADKDCGPDDLFATIEG